MRWESLSMRERAMLMNTYLRSGVTRLSDMRDHYNKFTDGGEVDNIQSTPAQDFIASWLSNRQEQFKENFRNSGSTMVPYSVLPKSWSNKAAFKEYQNQLKNLRTVKQYDVLGNTKFPHVPESEFEAIKRLSNHTGGAYNPSSHSISYISPYAGTDVHELTHSLNADPQINTIRYGFEGDKLQEGKQYNSYKDSADEIYARLMQFRYLNKLDPKKKYTVEDIKKWREKYDDTDIINRYSDEYLLHLLNNVASTKSSLEKDGRKLAAYGGPLKDERVNKFDEGGDIKRDSTNPIVRPIVAGNFQEKGPVYTGPIVGEIRADERSKTQKFFDRIKTNYNISTFGNSAVAEVLSATTPYGLVHEGMRGNSDSALLSVVPFGAVLKEGKAAANIAKSTYKAGENISNIPKRDLTGYRSSKSPYLEIPTFDDPILVKQRDLDQLQEGLHIQKQLQKETESIFNHPNYDKKVSPHISYERPFDIYDPEAIKNRLGQLNKNLRVDTEDFNRFKKYFKDEGSDAVTLPDNFDELTQYSFNIDSNDIQDFYDFLANNEGKILMGSYEKPYYKKKLSNNIRHESVHKYLDGVSYLDDNFSDLVQEIRLRSDLNFPESFKSYIDNPVEIAPRLKSLRTDLMKKWGVNYMDRDITLPELQRFVDTYSKTRLNKTFDKFEELKAKKSRTPKEEYLFNRYRREVLDLRRFNTTKGLADDTYEIIDNYDINQDLLNLINNAAPYKLGGFLK